MKSLNCNKFHSFRLLLAVFLLKESIQYVNAEIEADLVRPFLVRDIEAFGMTLPFSPITAIIMIVSFIILYRGMTKKSTAIASHILLDDTSEEAKKKLEKFKAEIGNDQTKFAKYAAMHSTCPSSKNGSPAGSLGQFTHGSMVPPFNDAVFSPKSKPGDIIGPIQTQFGWHLILLHEKDEQRQMIAG